MLHINDFKFRLKEKSENLFFNGNHKRTKFNSNLIPFEEILFNKNVSTLVTLGPKSSTPSSIEAISDYTKLFRLNGSHNTIDWHLKVSKLIRKACPKGLILLDIPGVKPRTNNKKIIEVKKGETLEFYHTRSSSYQEFRKIELTKPLPKIPKAPNSFSLSDGLYGFDLLEVSQNYILGRSRNDFHLQPKKGLNIPESIYDDALQMKAYSKFLNLARNIEFDAIGLSFIQNQRTIENIRLKFPDKLMVSKIENKLALENAVEIVNSSDIVMIDRGDLFAEIGIKDFYEAILKITEASKSHGRPLIMATENLESMQYRLQPSKSEIIALQHSINLGTNILMLSDETATSDLYMNTIRWLDGFLQLQQEQKFIY